MKSLLTATIWTLLILISPACSTNVVSHIVKGNLSDSWTFNVTIFAKELKGTILYCVDSGLNMVSIRVNVALNARKYFLLSFNNVFIRYSLYQMCGCDPCDGKFMNFRLQLANGTIIVDCNEYAQNSLKESFIKDNIPKSILEIMNNRTNSLYIGMGSKDDTEALTGCLESFYFNKKKIRFTEKGTYFVSSCEVKCKEGTCNKGKCDVTYPYGPLCDCSNSPFNGRHCNRTLKKYIQGKNTSFVQMDWSASIQFKLSWMQNSSRTFCLMDLIYGFDHAVFTVNKDNLMKGLEIISPIKYDGVNFINVNITDSYVLVKISEKTFQLKIMSPEKFRLDLGFSRSKEKCETFSGKYDFHYSKKQIQLVSYDGVPKSKVKVLWIVIPILVIALIIVVVLAVVIRRRKQLNYTKKEPEKSEDVLLDEKKLKEFD